MNKRFSIFASVVLLSFCQSATTMGRHLCYRRKLAAARPVRASLHKERCVLSVQSPLFIHAVVQAGPTTQCKSVFKQYVKELVKSNKRAGNWTSIDDSKKLYEHVVTHIPWNGKFVAGYQQAYPVLLNEREVSIYALCYQSKCVNTIYHTEIGAANDLLADAEHHQKICQQFKELIGSPIGDNVCINLGDSFGINQREYDEIKNAVFAKNGKTYATLFDIAYPQANKESLIALSEEFDAGSCRTWQETWPPVSSATISGQKFLIGGKIGAIIYDHQN